MNLKKIYSFLNLDKKLEDYEINEETVKYANFSFRMLALFIDLILSAIIIAPTLVLILKILGHDKISFFSNGIQGSQEDIMEQVASYLLLNFLQIILISILTLFFWSAKNGTPGKTILKMHIVDAKTFKPMNTGQIVWRMFAYIFSILPLGLGFISIEYSKKRQGFHDKLAGTVVIRLPKYTKAELEKQKQDKEDGKQQSIPEESQVTEPSDKDNS